MTTYAFDTYADYNVSSPQRTVTLTGAATKLDAVTDGSDSSYLSTKNTTTSAVGMKLTCAAAAASAAWLSAALTVRVRRDTSTDGVIPSGEPTGVWLAGYETSALTGQFFVGYLPAAADPTTPTTWVYPIDPAVTSGVQDIGSGFTASSYWVGAATKSRVSNALASGELTFLLYTPGQSQGGGGKVGRNDFYQVEFSLASSPPDIAGVPEDTARWFVRRR